MCVAERARLLADAAAGVVLQPTPEGGMEIVAASTPGDPGTWSGRRSPPGRPYWNNSSAGSPSSSTTRPPTRA